MMSVQLANIFSLFFSSLSFARYVLVGSSSRSQNPKVWDLRISFPLKLIRMFPKIEVGNPQIIHFHRVFPLFSPSILGLFPLFLETPINY